MKETDFTWQYVHSMSPCSVQVNANEKEGKITFNSNDWRGSQSNTACALAYLHNVVDEWVEEGISFTRFDIYLANYAWTDDITEY